MKNILSVTLLVALCLGMTACGKKKQTKLVFDASKGEARTLTMPDGKDVAYTAYEGLYYVTNVEDSTYQTMNIYVPNGVTAKSPIFLRTYVGGYMASAAGSPQAGDATGRALEEGYVVAIPGSRGRNSKVGNTYTGRAPKALLDLKAAIRYLRLFNKEIPGDAEKIVTDGTSAGGAMSALMGATGNNPEYESLLKKMGAAEERDNVFAAVCFCPITDLEHADMAYEWLYNQTDSRQHADQEILSVSNDLKGQFPEYLKQLQLTTSEGELLTAENYLDYIKKEIIRAAQIAKNAGADIPDSIGFVFSEDKGFGAPPINGGMTQAMETGGKRPDAPQGGRARGGMKNKVGEYIVDLDMPQYLNYVVSTQALKTAPAFDTKDVAGQAASGENEEFGDETGSSVNFTEYGARTSGAQLTDEVKKNVFLLNPMNFIGDQTTDVAPHWYIRHGARDRDTAFPIPINLALKLRNNGKDVNFLLAWNRPHSGDYALDELFEWLNDITK